MSTCTKRPLLSKICERVIVAMAVQQRRGHQVTCAFDPKKALRILPWVSWSWIYRLDSSLLVFCFQEAGDVMGMRPGGGIEPIGYTH